MKNKLILFLSILILIAQPISAYTYLNIYLDETGEALFLGETNEQIQLPEEIKLEKGDIIGKTNSLTNKQGELWEFSYVLEGAEMSILLPKNAKIKGISNGDISTEGKQILIYVQDETTIFYIIEEVKDMSYWFYLSSVILLILLLIYIWKSKKFLSKKKKPKENKLEIIKQTLNERQNKIIDKLKEVKEIKHSRLQKLVDIPKASFSRHIRELEKKGLIRRQGEGKNKILSLK